MKLRGLGVTGHPAIRSRKYIRPQGESARSSLKPSINPIGFHLSGKSKYPENKLAPGMSPLCNIQSAAGAGGRGTAIYVPVLRGGVCWREGTWLRRQGFHPELPHTGHVPLAAAYRSVLISWPRHWGLKRNHLFSRAIVGKMKALWGCPPGSQATGLSTALSSCTRLLR